MSAEQRAAGCVAASSGNHGAAVAYATQKLGVNGVIFVPEQTSPTKVAAIQSYGGEVRFFGTDGLDTEMHAREYAETNGLYYLSPYNDESVVAGQGSLGVEILTQMPEVGAVFIAVGGGGLIAGVGSYLKQHKPGVRIIGCQPENSPVMTRSIEAGRVLDLSSEATLSDGTAGGVEVDSITFGLCQQVVDDWVLVGEHDIAAAMRDYMDAEHQLIEGAAGVAIAGFRHRAADFAGQNVVILICGANISRPSLQKIIS